MSSWVNHTVLAGSSINSNGTSSHTCTFTAATAGNLLVAIVGSSATCSTPSGWTLLQSSVLDGSIWVFTKTASASESSFTTTHNGSNYPMEGVVYEFPSTASIIGTAGASNLNFTDPGPAFSGASNVVYTRFSARALNMGTGSTIAATTWAIPKTVDYDAYKNDPTTAGVYLSIACDDGCVSGGFTAYATTTSTSVSTNLQAVSFAVASNASTPTPIFEQGDSYGNSANSTTAAATFSHPVSAGNLIVVALCYQSTAVTASITDSQGNTYATAIGPTVSGTLGFSNYIFYAVAGSSGTNTITATLSNIAIYRRLLIHEYQGVDTFDLATGTTGASGAPDSGSIATTHANEVIFGWGITNNGTVSPGTGFTLRETALSESTEDKIVSSTGSYNAIYPNDGSAWTAQVAGFYYGHLISSGNIATTAWFRA